jgi:predicted alpha/beta-hydrolase family hydrolase
VSERVSVEWADGEKVTATVYRLVYLTMLLAHGAGTDQDHPLVAGIAERLADDGLGVVTFNYPYTETGRKAPDRAPKLLACHEAIARAVDSWSHGGIVLAGRSMGGRMATMLTAEGTDAVGVVCLAYPLHPAGKPERLRIEHLDRITVPMLFFQGSRDALSRGDLFDAHVRSLPAATVIDMEGANHSFRGRGWTQERVTGVVAEEYARWLASLAV